MSHADPKVNTTIIKATAKHFGNLVIARGKNHTFLGMDIGLLDDNKIEIGMKGYIQEAINVFDEEMSTKVSYPENKNLHKVNKYSHKPPTKQTEDLHSILENIL